MAAFFTSLGWSSVSELAVANEANGSQLASRARPIAPSRSRASRAPDRNGDVGLVDPFSPMVQHGLVAIDQQ
jgi:hypothetical protein